MRLFWVQKNAKAVYVLLAESLCCNHFEVGVCFFKSVEFKANCTCY
jgi:hypothetical protein